MTTRMRWRTTTTRGRTGAGAEQNGEKRQRTTESLRSPTVDPEVRSSRSGGAEGRRAGGLGADRARLRLWRMRQGRRCPWLSSHDPGGVSRASATSCFANSGLLVVCLWRRALLFGEGGRTRRGERPGGHRREPFASRPRRACSVLSREGWVCVVSRAEPVFAAPSQASGMAWQASLLPGCACGLGPLHVENIVDKG